MSSAVSALAIALSVGLAVGLGGVEFAASLVFVTLVLATISTQGLRATFGFALGGVLFGYAALGKGFAYLGAPPVYLGEVVVGLAVLVLLLVKPAGRSGQRRSPAVGALWVLIVVGVVVTVPGVKEYGIDALRDSVIWSYALIALAVVRVWNANSASVVVRAYELLAPIGVVLLTVRLLLNFAAPELLANPVVNGQALLQVKEGDAAVQLVVFLAFLLLFRGQGTRRWTRSALARQGLAGTAIVGLLAATVSSRGGMLAVAVILGVVFLYGKHRRVMIMAALVAMLLTLTLSPLLATFTLKSGRTLSAGQLVANIGSVFGGSSADIGQLAATRQWRERLWSNLLDQTFSGPSAIWGLGFGPNLPVRAGLFARPEDSPLRSAHSSPVTTVVRGGLLLAATWLLAFMLIVRDGLRARNVTRQPAAYRGALATLVLAALLGCAVNSVFDPYLESPMGGIWFWALCGAAIGLAALARSPRHLAASPVESAEAPRGRAPNRPALDR